jgi:autotransporter-associated beta strand protein
MKAFKPLLFTLASALLALPAFAVDTTTSEWTGGTTAWTTAATNWNNGAPSTTVSAKFDAAFTTANQPVIGSGVTPQGIWLATGLTQDVAISGAQSLAITGTATLSGQANAGIIMDDTANRNLTITTTSVSIAQNTGFYVNNTGTLTISGTVALGLRTLTLAGTNASGNIILNGPITSTGTAPGLVVNTAGTVTFAGTNTFGGTSGSLKLTAGTLNLNNTQAAGTKTFYIDGGTIDTTNGTAGLTAGNNVQQWRGNFTFKGTSNFDLGTGVVTLAPTGTTVNMTVTANKLTVGGAIGGVGKGITKLGAGTLTLSGSNTYTGATLVNVGTLIVNGTLAGTSVSVSSGAKLGGSGTLANAIISGAGQVGPGSSPGILTASQVNPTGGLGFNFEYTNTGAPTWNSPTASGNDVMRLTNATPFTASLTSANAINFYLDVPSLADSTSYQGGFFTDQISNFFTSVSSATKAFYVKGDGLGLNVYNGVNYYTLAEYNTNVSGSFSVTLGTFQVASANFQGGPAVTDGWVTELNVVPEPATWGLLAFSLTAVMVLRRRRTR